MVTSGRGRGVVVATGGDTAIGKIRDAMSDQVERLTPLKQKLDEFGSLLSKVIAAICVLVWVGGTAAMPVFASAVRPVLLVLPMPHRPPPLLLTPAADHITPHCTA